MEYRMYKIACTFMLQTSLKLRSHPDILITIDIILYDLYSYHNPLSSKLSFVLGQQ